jgi:2-iminobutanoate/2-iminopropanoate deaminase
VKQIVSGPGVPTVIGAYSPAVRGAGLLFVSGQPGVDPVTGAPVGSTLAEQARQAFANLAAVLRTGGSSPELVLNTVILVTDISQFAVVNEEFGAFFPTEPPARMVMQVPLPGSLLISVGCTALLES